MTKARTPSVLPFGVVLIYIRPLFKMRLLQIWKNILPCSVSASALRHSLRKVSHHGSGVSFLRQSHLQHAARAASASWASSQSTMCIGSSFAACTLASWLKPHVPVRRNLTMHHLVTPFIIRQPIQRPCLLERVYKPMHTSH